MIPVWCYNKVTISLYCQAKSRYWRTNYNTLCLHYNNESFWLYYYIIQDKYFKYKQVKVVNIIVSCPLVLERHNCNITYFLVKFKNLQYNRFRCYDLVTPSLYAKLKRDIKNLRIIKHSVCTTAMRVFDYHIKILSTISSCCCHLSFGLWNVIAVCVMRYALHSFLFCKLTNARGLFHN